MKKRNINYVNKERGQAIITATIFFLAASLIILGGVARPLLQDSQNIRQMIESRQSFFLSEGGIEDAVYRIKKGKLIGNSETLIVGSHTAVTTISSPAQDEKLIRAVGDVSQSVRALEVELATSVGIDFFYGSQAGEGGIEMGENSRIEGAGGAVGNVYSNGPIIGANGATITGDATVSTLVAEDVQARSTVCNQDQIIGNTSPEVDFAMSFSPSGSQPLSKISLYIKKVDTPASRTVYITADNGGVPANASLAQGTLTSSLVGTGYAWIDIVFSSPATLTSGTTYWIILDAKTSPLGYWVWCKDSNQGYGNGEAYYSDDWNNDPWTTIVGDLTFKTFLGAGINALDSVIVGGTAKANTILNSSIGVDAYYQTIDVGSTVTGTSYPGSFDPSPVNLPISEANIMDWKNDAGCGTQPAISPCDYSGSYDMTEDTSLGPLTIDGDFSLTTNNKILTVTGILYVKGNIDIANGSSIVCDASYGADSCVIVSDGWIHLSNNGSFQGSGQSDSFIMLLSTLACDGSSSSPPCDTGHHNGAIDLHNNATGAIFYASEGLVNLHNGVNITEVTGYKLNIENTAVVSYETGLISSSFSSGPSGSWKIQSWSEVE